MSGASLKFNNTLVDGFGSLTGAVGFWVVCKREFQFDSSQFVKCTPEFYFKTKSLSQSEMISLGNLFLQYQ